MPPLGRLARGGPEVARPVAERAGDESPAVALALPLGADRDFVDRADPACVADLGDEDGNVETVFLVGLDPLQVRRVVGLVLVDEPQRIAGRQLREPPPPAGERGGAHARAFTGQGPADRA